MKVKIVKAFKPVKNLDTLLPGDILEARFLSTGIVPGRFQCIEGKYSGIDIPFEYCMKLPEERIYSEAEYNALKDSYENKILIMEHSMEQLDRGLGQRIIQLESERDILVRTIECAADELNAAKPAIPAEVAEAITLCKAVMSPITIITSLDHIGQLFRDYDKNVLDALKVIRIFAQKTVGGGQDLLAALVNGYRVEADPDPDDKLATEVAGMIDAWLNVECEAEDLEADIKEFSKRVVDFFKEQKQNG